jgi:hypothetical protein
MPSRKPLILRCFVKWEVIAKLEREGRAQATLSKNRWLLDFAYPMFGEN